MHETVVYVPAFFLVVCSYVMCYFSPLTEVESKFDKVYTVTEEVDSKINMTDIENMMNKKLKKFEEQQNKMAYTLSHLQIATTS